MLFMLMAAVLTGSLPAKTHAQAACTDKQLKYLQVAMLDCTGGGPATCSTGFAGSNNVEIAYNYLVSQGLTSQQAAGIVGNLMAESGQSIDPKAVNSSGYTGIAQWDKNGRWARLVTWAKQNNKDEFVLETQLEYLWLEATARKNIEGIKQYGDVEHTAWYWGRFFEVAIIGGSDSTKPLTNVQHLDRRTDYARTVFAQFSGNSGGAVSASACSATLANVQCPATMEAHPSMTGYFKMPEAPNGEYIIYSAKEQRYGSKQLVCVLYSVALAYNQAMAGKSRVLIGDLNAAGHKSHKWGVAVDMSAAGDNQAASHSRAWKGRYSKEATVLIGRLLVDTGTVRNIWWCPPAGDSSIQDIQSYANQVSKPLEGAIKCIEGHQDHFHVDIKSEYRLQAWEP